MIKAAIFDMDGTTVNTINSIAYFANAALNKFGLEGFGADEYKLMVGNGAKTLVKRMVSQRGGEDKYDCVLQEYNTTYDNDFMYLTEPYSGIVELLEQLKKDGIKRAIVSNKPVSTARKVSDKLFGSLVDFCIGATEGVALKPDSAMCDITLDKLGVSADECIYIGDTSTDMMTAKNSGFFSVGVLWGFRGREELEANGADVIVEKPEEIKKIIDRLNNAC